LVIAPAEQLVVGALVEVGDTLRGERGRVAPGRQEIRSDVTLQQRSNRSSETPRVLGSHGNASPAGEHVLESLDRSPNDRHAERHGQHGRLGPGVAPRGHDAGRGACDPFGRALPPAGEDHVVLDAEPPGTGTQLGLQRTAAYDVQWRAVAQECERLQKQVGPLLVVQSAHVDQPPGRDAGGLRDVGEIDRRAALA